MIRNIFYAIFCGLLFFSCSSQASGGDAERDAHHHHDTEETTEVEVTKRQIETVGIKTGTLEQRAMGASVKVSGRLSVDPQGVADVVPAMSGIVRRVLVIDGQTVKAGQPVAMIENIEVAEMQRRYIDAKEKRKRAELELKRQKSLAEAGAGIRRNLELAESEFAIANEAVVSLSGQLKSLGVDPSSLTNKNVLLTLPVKAPISGVVSNIQTRTGAYADIASSLMTVTNNSAVYANLNIYEKDLPVVHPGDNVECTLTNLPSVQLTGTVEKINPTLDMQTRTFSARVRLNHAGAGVVLSPGMSLTATITGQEEVVDVLPSEAVVSSDGVQYVFMLEEEHEDESHFRKVDVVTGPSARGYTAVSFPTPVDPHARFVISGTFYLVSMSSEHAQHSH